MLNPITPALPNPHIEEVLPKLLEDRRATRFTARTVEMQTYISDHRQLYLVRADMEITAAIQVFPFEIKMISGPTMWRAKFRRCRISRNTPVLNFDEARALLRDWASGMIQSRPAQTAEAAASGII